MSFVSLDSLKKKEDKIAVVGLGYVGLPLAVLLAKHFSVVGFDINSERIQKLQGAHDETREVSHEALQNTAIQFTSQKETLKETRFFIVAVPTPVDARNVPDLAIVRKATEMVGRELQKGSVVVFESTVYPGVTEEICLPILEEMSGLKGGVDFYVGYSPERVNPGDKTHTIDQVVKVVSGQNAEALEIVAGVYGSVTKVFRAASVKVAEAAKVIENTQRDINIAFMNELAMIFQKMNISIYDVLDAAKTKWNFLPFAPGLVGGHCIGVDPYYLTHKAEELGHTPEIILAGRGINDRMHAFLAGEIAKTMANMGKEASSSTVVILGITFKENIPDVRNSKVALLYKELQRLGMNPIVCDPHADPKLVQEEYGIALTPKENLPKADVLVVAVPHQEFAELSPSSVRLLMGSSSPLLVDFKRVYKKEDMEKEGIVYWSL